MEHLTHKATGELVVKDPFKTVGTKVAYNYKGTPRVGTITEAALEMRERSINQGAHAHLQNHHDDPVYAEWNTRVSWMPREELWIVD